MSESPLEKVVRLAGGITRSYVRSSARGPVRVTQYANHRKVSWGSLKAGQKVILNGVPFQVLKVGVPVTKAQQAQAKAAQAKAAAKLKAQGPSAAQKTALQKATAAAAAKAKTGASGTAPAAAKAAAAAKHVRIELRNLVSGRTVVMSQPAGLVVYLA